MNPYDKAGIIIHIFLALLVIFMIIIRKSYKIIFKDFTDSLFIIFFIFIVLLSYWGLYIRKGDNDRTKQATQRAIMAFIIAYMAHVDLIFVAFIFVWIYVYHTGENWV